MKGHEPDMPNHDLRDQLLFSGGPEGAVELSFPAAFGSASRAIDAIPAGVYEGLRTFGGNRFFGLRTHLERLRESAAGFARPLQYDEQHLVRTLDSAARQAAAAFDGEARLRVDVTAEPATALGSDSCVLIAATPFRGVPEALRTQGAHLQLAPGLRRPDPAVKTSNFIPLREAWIQAHGDPDAYEFMMVSDEGMVLEGTQSNVVLVRDGALHHAPSGVLPGVTVRAVLDLARAAGLPVHERFVPVEELADYDEAFMTTSVRSVVPIRSIGEHRFLGAGPVTARVAALYDELTAADAVTVEERASARY